MTPLMTVEELEARLPANALPLDAEGSRDDARITLALQEATGVIVAHLPWLLDPETGEIALPVLPRFRDALIGICTDTALYRLTDRVSSHEDDRDRYAANMKLLDKIDREYQGGLSGPDYQEASIVDAAADESLEDDRYFKKGSPL
jgi:phage gp36-like protein